MAAEGERTVGGHGCWCCESSGCNAREYLGGRILPSLALHVLFCLRHHQGENDYQHVVFATSLDVFDNPFSKNIELKNVVGGSSPVSMMHLIDRIVSRLI